MGWKKVFFFGKNKFFSVCAQIRYRKSDLFAWGWSVRNTRWRDVELAWNISNRGVNTGSFCSKQRQLMIKMRLALMQRWNRYVDNSKAQPVLGCVSSHFKFPCVHCCSSSYFFVSYRTSERWSCRYLLSLAALGAYIFVSSALTLKKKKQRFFKSPLLGSYKRCCNVCTGQSGFSNSVSE